MDFPEGSSVMAGEPLPSVMKAVRVHKFGGPEVLQLDTDVPLPTCGAKQVDDSLSQSLSQHILLEHRESEAY